MTVGTPHPLEQLLEDLCIQFKVWPPPRLEWSRRMTNTLGKAYPTKDLIRLSGWLSEQQSEDTLRHELAHIAASRESKERPHGPAWKRWAARLGADTRSRSPSPPVRAPKEGSETRYWGLECPACGVRLSRKRVQPGLYHRGCGPSRGRLARRVRGARETVLAWAGQTD